MSWRSEQERQILAARRKQLRKYVLLDKERSSALLSSTFLYKENMTTLYVVGTPIGNLEDITLRALRILKEVDMILCEDTRVTKRLLSRYEIGVPVMTYHAHSSGGQHEKILDLLREGKNLALVSDAGTPGISDPGVKLVEQVREELPAVSVVTIPGPSALIAALSISGIPASEFLFLGFLPHKKGREKKLAEALAAPYPVVFYESPHRIMKMLSALEKKDSTRKILLLRELTKIYEEVISGTAAELTKILEEHPQKKQGEFVVIVTPR